MWLVLTSLRKQTRKQVSLQRGFLQQQRPPAVQCLQIDLNVSKEGSFPGGYGSSCRASGTVVKSGNVQAGLAASVKADGKGLDVDPRRVGIVKSVDAKQRTATVRWLKIVQRPEEPREFESEEVVSVYELVEHPDYSYCLGDVVIRLTPSPMASDETPFMDGSDAAVSSGVEETSEVDADENEACTSRSSSVKLLKQSAKGRGRSSKGLRVSVVTYQTSKTWIDNVGKVG